MKIIMGIITFFTGTIFLYLLTGEIVLNRLKLDINFTLSATLGILVFGVLTIVLAFVFYKTPDSYSPNKS